MTSQTNANPDYQKTLRVKASSDALFDALTTASGLSAWWTRATGSGEAGGELKFFMNFPEPLVVRVDQATRAKSVQWTVEECSFLPDWVGTRPTFTITPLNGDACELTFRHHGLTSELECIEMCTRGWNHYLESLRQYAEVGRGMPRGSSEDKDRRINN
jgi:uncharacterized protein YndB with AHSA1/START domain